MGGNFLKDHISPLQFTSDKYSNFYNISLYSFKFYFKISKPYTCKQKYNLWVYWKHKNRHPLYIRSSDRNHSVCPWEMHLLQNSHTLSRKGHHGLAKITRTASKHGFLLGLLWPSLATLSTFTDSW